MIIIKTRIFHLISHFPNFCSKSLGSFLNEITTDDELKAVLSYSFGDYGMVLFNIQINVNIIFFRKKVLCGHFKKYLFTI